MKAVITIILALFFYQTNGLAQGLTSNSVTLSAKSGDSANLVAVSSAGFSLNSFTQEFTGIIDMLPSIPDKAVADSLNTFSNGLQLKLTGTFPIPNMDFLTVTDNGKPGEMEVSCTLNNVVKKQRMSFSLVVLKDAANSGGFVQVFPGRISFLLLIDPAEYTLDQQPFVVTKPILINCPAALITKANQ